VHSHLGTLSNLEGLHVSDYLVRFSLFIYLAIVVAQIRELVSAKEYTHMNRICGTSNITEPKSCGISKP